MKMIPFTLSPSAYTDYLTATKMHKNWPVFSNIWEEGRIGYGHKNHTVRRTVICTIIK